MKNKRVVVVALLLAGFVGFVGIRTSAHVRETRTTRSAADRKAMAKIFEAHPWKLGTGKSTDCAAPKTGAAAIARTAPRVAGTEQCGEYSCQYDWGTGINVCFQDCDWTNFIGSIWLHCRCGDGGDCQWGY